MLYLKNTLKRPIYIYIRTHMYADFMMPTNSYSAF